MAEAGEGQRKSVSARDLLVPIYNRMTTAFYILMRDYLMVGEVNKLIKASMIPKETSFSDEILRAKAESLASQMINGEYQVTEIDAMWSIRGSGDMGATAAISPEALAGLRSMMQEFGKGKGTPPPVDPRVAAAAAKMSQPRRSTPPDPPGVVRTEFDKKPGE